MVRRVQVLSEVSQFWWSGGLRNSSFWTMVRDCALTNHPTFARPVEQLFSPIMIFTSNVRSNVCHITTRHRSLKAHLTEKDP